MLDQKPACLLYSDATSSPWRVSCKAGHHDTEAHYASEQDKAHLLEVPAVTQVEVCCEMEANLCGHNC